MTNDKAQRAIFSGFTGAVLGGTLAVLSVICRPPEVDVSLNLRTGQSFVRVEVASGPRPLSQAHQAGAVHAR